MSKEILIDKDAFRNAVDSISNIVGNIDNIKNEITNVNGELKGSWRGKSSKAFFSESENIANTFTDYTEGLVSLCEDLSMVLSEFSNLDSKIAGNIIGGE